MDTQQKRWNRIFERHGKKRPIYDDWLDRYAEVFESSKSTPVIDLGCGSGNNTLYLCEQGYPVVSCDFAEAALQRLSNFIPNPVPLLFDLRRGFPFKDGAARIVVADLCLHYFPELATKKIIAEIRRILGHGGWLFSRVNSVNDIHYGAGEGVAIESLYYEQNGNQKRFFDESSLRAFFAEWKIKALQECDMTRYEKPKSVWEFAAQK